MASTSDNNANASMPPTPVRRVHRPPFEGLYPYIFLTFLAFCVSDLIIVGVRDQMLPTQAPPSRPPRNDFRRPLNRGSLGTITQRNFFAEGQIPEPMHLRMATDQQKKDAELPPIPSQLPLNLMGTIVHSNPEKSIANVEVTGKNSVLPFRVNQDIENLATLTKVERGKIFIRNLSSNRLEFIELKEKMKLNFGGAKAMSPVPKAGAPQVAQTAPNKFEISRAEVMKQMADLPTFLNTAAMQPNRKANGEVDGFKFIAIQPGSAISQLGFRAGDVIKSVNGEPVTSPAQAMELYQQFRSATNVKLGVNRDGKDQEFDYTVK